jgi:hypothetical protein
MTRITDEAIEAAANACHDVDFAWSSDGIIAELWRKMGRAALEAALPHLEGGAAPTREQIAEELDIRAYPINGIRMVPVEAALDAMLALNGAEA